MTEPIEMQFRMLSDRSRERIT